MTTPEYPAPIDDTPENPGDDTERAGEYVDITDNLTQLQADFIDHLTDYATANPHDDSYALSGIDYLDQKVGRDFSHLDWLKRGDELTVGGDIALVLVGHDEYRYFINLGENATLNGHALNPHVTMVPVKEAIPHDVAPFDVFKDCLNQWSVAIELHDVIIGMHDPVSDEVKIEENLDQHFRVFLPLAYENIYVDRHVTTPPAASS
jgi:hypothetical protein